MRAHYQSHHTGIETRDIHVNNFFSETTNRTILELKHGRDSDIGTGLELPIAPHRN